MRQDFRYSVDMKVWSSSVADKKFSQYMREKYPQCQNCGRTVGIGVSHFWGRTHSSTRYDEDNCDVLCWLPCHYTWEHEKQGAYKDFMIKKLGLKKYNILQRKAHTTMPRRDAIIALQQKLGVYN